MPTESVQQTLAVLRDGSHFSWSVITLFVVVVYVYASEIDRGNVNGVLAGLAFFGADVFNETWNGLVLHFTGTAPAWSVRGESAYVILIGLNLEIALMFAISGIAATKALPGGPELRIAGLPNRWFFVIFWSALSVAIECALNAIGVLVWEHAWWNARAPYLIFLIGYVPFYAIAYWVYDMKDRSRQVRTVAGLLGLDALALTTFGSLGWI